MVATVQLHLNLILVCIVPASKNTRFACVQPKICIFVDLHTNKNPLRVSHECTTYACASLGTQYTPASTNNTQVTRVPAGKKSYTQVCSPFSTGTLEYLRGINHCIIGLFTSYNLSCTISLFLKRLHHYRLGY